MAQDIAHLSGAPAVSIEFTSDADLTLAQGQYQAESITFTDSPATLTAGRVVVFPAHFPTKWVKNSTAQTLTLKKSGQTGVTLAAGAYGIVASGAADVVLGPGTSVPCDFIVAISDESTALTTGTAKVTFRATRAMTLTKIKASLSTASSSGNPAFDVKKNGVSVFSTALTIDATEKTSETAATAAVLSTTAIAADDEITIDITVAGTGAKGAKIGFVGTY